MKNKIMICVFVMMLSAFAGSALGYTEVANMTFFGLNAGLVNDASTYHNTFIGHNAGSNNTTGDYNTFVGRGAGNLNITSSNNTFIGYWAGLYNTASNNTFIGYYAGYLNTTGQYNTFFGSQAGVSNSSGYGNNFMGYRAGYVTTTGYHNNFMGYLAGNSNTTGVGNTAVGSYAGFTNQTSNYNTFIGYSAGLSATGGGNVFIGYKAGRYETGSNKLYIDNSDTATPLIYGDFAANTVEINGILYAVMGSPSSRELKDNIQWLKAEDAMETLQGLNPVTFNYKTSPEENHVGFIAEDVPELVAMKDHKAIGPMDVVAVLTKVVQEQQKTISSLQYELNELKEKIN